MNESASRRIFISYARQDRERAAHIVKVAQEAGHDVWWDTSLAGGQDWWEEILRRIRECDIFLVVLTRDALTSQVCALEREYARALKRAILPVSVVREDFGEQLPRDLRQLQVVDYVRPESAESAMALVKAFRTLPLEELPAPPPQPPMLPVRPLDAIRERLRSDNPLGDEEQRRLVWEFKRLMRDRSTRSAVRGLIEELKGRRELLAEVSQECDEVLARLSWRRWLVYLSLALVILLGILAAVPILITAPRKPSDTSGPSLTVIEPQEGAQVPPGTLVVKGTVKDASPPCKVDVNGAPAMVTGEAWELEVAVTERTRALTVSAHDGIGNASAELRRDITVLPAPPPPPECAPIAGFTSLPKNPQGYCEYRHDRSGIVFVSLPGWKFRMGSPEGEEGHDASEGPAHEVELSPFLMAKYEVSQAEWRRVMEKNPSQFQGDDLPVEQVSWEDANAFCEKTGLALPTEAQWEYACRAGTTTPFAFGETITTDQVNYESRDVTRGGDPMHTVPVKSFAPNAFGLYQMHGNVYEWCEDVFNEKFYGKPEASGKDPLCTSGSRDRVLRGGSWFYPAADCRSAYRSWYWPRNRFLGIGFRPARPLP